MDLQEIDIIQPQAFQTRIHTVEDVLAAQPTGVDVAPGLSLLGRHLKRVFPALLPSLAHRRPELRRDDDVFPGKGVFPDGGSEDLLRGSVAVDVGRVEEVDPGLIASVEDGESVGFFHGPCFEGSPTIAKAHAAHADAGDSQAGFAEVGVFHCALGHLVRGSSAAGPFCGWEEDAE